MTFENLDYKVTVQLNKADAKLRGTKTEERHILKGLSGYVNPGETLFIMGASGAGKTSLLNAISDRISITKTSKLEGKVMVNDTDPLTQATFGNYAGYVMQDDVLFEWFTVREALTFAVRLKLTSSILEQDKRVEEVINELGLKDIANMRIGSVKHKTISGGERKRVAIGVEIVTNPSLLILDEPTSGLDSFKANTIVRLLRKLSRQGKTIIATIHQPGSDTFALFDKLILLQDGHMVYQGTAKDSASYFGSIGYQCKRTQNPADYYMRILSVNYPK